MRHNVAGRLFHRTANQRKALIRGLIISLFEHQRIETTLGRAKAIKRIAERIVTMGIKGDLHSKRVALSNIPNRSAVAKLFNVIAPRFKGSNGGYLRIVHTRNRVNDGAPMAIVEFTDYESVKKETAPAKVAEKKS